MPKRFVKKYLPRAEIIKNNKALGFLGSRIHDPGLWHLNRRSVSGGVAIGLFMCWIPFPPQMVIAGILAMWFRVNFPISVALVWLTNPVTIPPLFYAAYKLGTRILGTEHRHVDFGLSMEWLASVFEDIWAPLLVGSVSFAIVSSLIGYISVRLLWRLALIRRWQARLEIRKAKRAASANKMRKHSV